MNKFLCLALLAFVGCVVAQTDDISVTGGDDDVEEFSELTVMPTDQREVAYLSDNNKIFTDFCIRSRDTVGTYLKDSVNSGAASVFQIFFSSINDAGEDLLRVNKEAVEEGARLIKENRVEPKSSDPEDVLESLQETAENLSLLENLKTASKAVVNAVIETARTQLVERLALLRAQISADKLKLMIDQVCNGVSYNLKNQLDQMLAQTKAEMRKSASKSSAVTFADVIDKTRLDNVGCLTVGRVTKIAKFCDIIRIAGTTILPLIMS